ncbi:MAG: 50S ribosomal protein L6 [Patescibacteria group bacterium]|nr:50S ribosomal protein L6 [Patescibacteria group bacterium]
MSRIGKQPIEIPNDVTISIDDRNVQVKGPKGTLDFSASYEVELSVEKNQLIVKKIGKTKNAPAFWGTTRASIQNMVEGVTNGFKKELELHGVGYKMAVQGNKLVLNLGYSHPIEMEIFEGLNVSIDNNVLTVEGIDKQQVGEFAAVVRSKRKVEPYKGKGFRYVGEQFIKKEGKRAVAAE